MRKAPAPEKRKWVRLTRACNNRCLFCLDEDALNGSVVPESGIKTELAAGRKAGYTRVVLSGGEPTLHPKFVEIVRLARRLGYRHVQAVSNGRLFCYSDFLKAAVAAGLDEVTFSVHGGTPELHDRLVGVKGAFFQTVRGLLNALRTPGLIVSSDVVVNKLNVDSLGGILRFLRGLGVHEYDLLQIMPFGRAWKNWGELYYDPAARKGELGRAFDLSLEPGLRVWANRFRPEFFEGREKLIQHPEKLLDEINGQRRMFEAFLKGTGVLHCAGGRCRFCPLETFCRDLGVLREKGSLAALPPPLCACAPPGLRGRVRAAAGLDAIGRFFVSGRFALKGAACAACARREGCPGVNVFWIMKHGFGVFKPFPKERP